MKYHAPTKQFTVDKNALERATYKLTDALRRIRLLANLPLDKYTRDGPLTAACFAQIAIIEAAEALGIDLGVPSHQFNQLDLRDES